MVVAIWVQKAAGGLLGFALGLIVAVLLLAVSHLNNRGDRALGMG